MEADKGRDLGDGRCVALVGRVTQVGIALGDGGNFSKHIVFDIVPITVRTGI